MHVLEKICSSSYPSARKYVWPQAHGKTSRKALQAVQPNKQLVDCRIIGKASYINAGSWK